MALPASVPRQIVIFRVADTRYGFDIAAVEEILAPEHVTRVADAPNGVLGLTDIRGRAVPVFDLHWKFGVPAKDDFEARFVLVRTFGGSVALLVDAVEEVADAPAEAFQPVAAPGSADGLAYLNGVFHHGDDLVLWVEPARLVPLGVAQSARPAA